MGGLLIDRLLIACEIDHRTTVRMRPICITNPEPPDARRKFFDGDSRCALNQMRPALGNLARFQRMLNLLPEQSAPRSFGESRGTVVIFLDCLLDTGFHLSHQSVANYIASYSNLSCELLRQN